MDLKKLVIYNIITLAIMLLTLYLYFNKGVAPLSYTTTYAMTVAPAMLSLIAVFILNLFVVLAYTVKRALHKKNYLRVSFIVMIILILVNLAGRVLELMAGAFCIFCWINLILYIIQAILIYMILKDLYKLIRELFSIE